MCFGIAMHAFVIWKSVVHTISISHPFFTRSLIGYRTPFVSRTRLKCRGRGTGGAKLAETEGLLAPNVFSGSERAGPVPSRTEKAGASNMFVHLFSFQKSILRRKNWGFVTHLVFAGEWTNGECSATSDHICRVSKAMSFPCWFRARKT